MTRVFLIRHAEAEGNIFRRAHGHYQGLITGKGYVQIERLRERFKNEKIDAIYSSDLKRAHVTATALSEPRGLSITTAGELREVKMGVWEDMSWGDIERDHKEMGGKFSFDPANWHVSGSEPYESVVSRMTSFIKETAERHDGETIALFSHGFAIRSFFCRLMGFESHESEKVQYCDNTAVALLLYENGELKIEYQSDNSHLLNKDSTFAHQNWWRDTRSWTTENMNYSLLDEVRDKDMLESFQKEVGNRPAADIELAAFLGSDPAGVVGIDEKCRKQNAESGDGGADGNIGWLRYIYLTLEFQGKGFGIQLLGMAVSELRRLGKEAIRIETPRGNPIVKLCKKHGFDIVKESDSYFLMEKDIRN